MIMTKKKLAVIIVLAALAVAAVYVGLQYKALSDRLWDIDYIIMYSYSREDNCRVEERLEIEPEKWDCYPYKGISPHHTLSYMAESKVVMKDGTEYDAYYYPHDDAFSVFGMNGYYAARETTKFKRG